MKMTVSKPCNLQYLVSKEVCATGWLFFFSMRDLRGMHVGRVTPSGDYIYIYSILYLLEYLIVYPPAPFRGPPGCEGYVRVHQCSFTALKPCSLAVAVFEYVSLRFEAIWYGLTSHPG